VPKKLTILVSGTIAAVPHQGGGTWAVLQFLLGLKELGHDVYFVEQLNDSVAAAPHPPLEESVYADYFHSVMSEFGIADTSALMLKAGRQSVGMTYDEICSAARRADALLNISGVLTDETLVSEIPVRIYLDLDPAFTQLWQEVERIDLHLQGHTHFATVGLAIGKPDCTIPTCGVDWIPMYQPIVLGHWPRAKGVTLDALTTIANWRGYGSVQHDGVFYGQKAHSLRQFMNLPLLTDEKFLLALAIHPDERKDLEALQQNRWSLMDPAEAAATPSQYRSFIQGSKAEFGIAKSGYVLARCAWFSDRSVCYLASGRPVIAQETGFSRFLPAGEGLFAFQTPEDVLNAIEELRRDYSRHTRAARAIAEEYFDARKVLSSLLRETGAMP
jgi:hypothetical protein